jgi:tetratricopeptide (TPR) repeat protein
MSPESTCPLNQQVSQLIEQGKYQEAIPIAERAIEVSKRALGAEHRETAHAMNNLGLLFQKIGYYAKAEPLLQEALRIRQKALGSEYPDTADSLDNLASLYRANPSGQPCRAIHYEFSR